MQPHHNSKELLSTTAKTTCTQNLPGWCHSWAWEAVCTKPHTQSSQFLHTSYGEHSSDLMGTAAFNTPASTFVCRTLLRPAPVLLCNRMQLRPENAEHVAIVKLCLHLLEKRENCRGKSAAVEQIRQILFPQLSATYIFYI